MASPGQKHRHMDLPPGLIPPTQYHNINTSGDSRGHYGHVINYNVSSAATSDDEKASAILRALSYPQMGARLRKVHETGDDEYKWAFRWYLPLKTWLADEEGIFWISGKAGSGKSTFMKFLHSHPKTEELLHAWAAGKHLVVAAHFFWYAGSSNELERTREGMLRTLLLDALYSLPEADQVQSIKKVFSNKWPKKARVSEDITWTESELFAALERLVKSSGVAFVFFIDGLDEYSPAEEHGQLIRQLKQLSRNCNAKFCVSSRPWLVFDTHFGQLRSRLDLHELTRVEMYRYVVSKLGDTEQDTGVHCDFQRNTDDLNDSHYSSPLDSEKYDPEDPNDLADMPWWLRYADDPSHPEHPRWVAYRRSADFSAETNHIIRVSGMSDDAEQLVTLIVDKAEGVFLWVHLIILDLQKYVSRGQGVQRLLEYVEQASPDLHHYFKTHILERIPSSDLSEVCQVLKVFAVLAEASDKTGDDGFHSILNFWHMQKNATGLRDPHFALRSEFKLLTLDEVSSFIKETRAYMASMVGDFVTIDGIRFDFMHRSIRDYLLEDEMQIWMRTNVFQHFYAPEFMANLTLARLKAIPLWEAQGIVWGRSDRYDALRLHVLAAVKSIRDVYHTSRTIKYGGFDTFTVTEFPDLPPSLVLAYEEVVSKSLQVWTSEQPTLQTERLIIHHDCIEMFVSYGFVDLARQYIECCPDFTFSHKGAKILSMIVRNLWNMQDLEPYAALLDLILKQGILPSNGPWHTFLWLWWDCYWRAAEAFNLQPPERLSALRSLWTIAQAFIASGADLDSRLCGSHRPVEAWIDEDLPHRSRRDDIFYSRMFSDEYVCNADYSDCTFCSPMDLIRRLLDSIQTTELDDLLVRQKSTSPAHLALQREERKWKSVERARRYWKSVRTGNCPSSDSWDPDTAVVHMLSETENKEWGLRRVDGPGHNTTYRNIFEFADISVEPRLRPWERKPVVLPIRAA